MPSSSEGLDVVQNLENLALRLMSCMNMERYQTNQSSSRSLSPRRVATFVMTFPHCGKLCVFSALAQTHLVGAVQRGPLVAITARYRKRAKHLRAVCTPLNHIHVPLSVSFFGRHGPLYRGGSVNSSGTCVTPTLTGAVRTRPRGLTAYVSKVLFCHLII